MKIEISHIFIYYREELNMSEGFSTFTGQETQETCNQNGFKEAVCIDAYRVYDSCADKDCLEDMRVYFTEAGQNVIEQACNVRMKDVRVINACVDLEPVAFQKGFYSVDITFFFEIDFDASMAPCATPVSVCGLALFSKKVILYGSEGNVKVFSSDSTDNGTEAQSLLHKNLPRATVQVAEPIGLSSTVCEVNPNCCTEPQCNIPSCICQRYGGEFVCGGVNKVVRATIGLFTIVQIERNVQMLIPAYDFCIPDKECVTSSDNPCELFSRIDFPTDEFFPPRAAEVSEGSTDGFGCCCKHKK